MIETAEQKGLISPSRTVVIEPTSGNTGIGLASVCASKGYKCILVMPENMSKERIKLIKAYGADVVLSPKEKGMQGAVDTANDLKKNMKVVSFLLNSIIQVIQKFIIKQPDQKYTKAAVKK
jgi:cysteine synthase A